jgi:hypothetical protein
MARRPGKRGDSSSAPRGEQSWEELLFAPRDSAGRMDRWKALLNEVHSGQRHIEEPDEAELLDGLLAEPDADVRSYGLVVLQRARSAAARRFGSALWAPFGPDWKAAIVAVNDKAHIKDVDPLVELGRFFPKRTHPRTSFHTVSLSNPDWGQIRPESLDALCLVGRRSMFRGCVVLDALRKERGRDLGLRFSLPEDSHARRGGPLSAQFHHVREGLSAGPLRHVTTQQDGQRVDYAAIQRLTARVGGRRTTILFIEGATSLGTCGAAHWLTSIENLDTLNLRDVSSSSTIEILLQVKAAVHVPERPWEPQAVATKLLVNGTNVIAQAPRTVTVVIPGNQALDVRHVGRVLFDGDEVEYRGDTNRALLAVCVKMLRNQADKKTRDVVAVDDLHQDRSCWSSAWRPAFPAFYRDHLKRHVFREALSVYENPSTLELSCEFVRRFR